MPPYSVLPTDRAASSSRDVRPPLVWSAGLAILLLLDVFLLVADRPLHQALFEGELGIVEFPTFLMLIAAAIVAGLAARRELGGARIVFTLLALGCLYWGGEEVSWGQTFFHWATPAGWAAGNYQHEANLHNERGIVGTLLNVAPRFLLQLVAYLTVILGLPWAGRLRERFRHSVGARWLAPLSWCLAPAVLVVVSALLNKLKPLGYRSYGENQEFYLAAFMLAYAWFGLRSRSTDV